MESVDIVDASVSDRGSVLGTVEQIDIAIGGELDREVAKKRQELEERLSKRDEERHLQKSKRTEEKSKNTAENEKSDYFSSTFSTLKANIETKLLEADSVDKESLIDYFDAITKEFQHIERFVADSTIFLPSYDVRVAQEKLKLLLHDIQSKENELLPKKKFTFKNRKKEASSKDTVDAACKIEEKNTFDIKNERSFDFEGVENLTLVKNADEIYKKDVSLANLKGCYVYLYGISSTLHIQRLRNCKVFTGPVATSIFISDCTNCVFITACQQLRVHSTNNCHFYLHVASRAIIEDSTALEFAPYNWHYEDIQKHFSEAGFKMKQLQWNAVDDFNWLARDVPSPNWSEIPEEARVKTWN